MIDCRETAETARKPFGINDNFRFAGLSRRNNQLLVSAPFFFGEQADKTRLQIPCPRFFHEFDWRSRSQHTPGIHRHDPVPLLGLVHVSGRNKNAHVRSARADVIDQRPKLTAGKRIDTCGGFIEDEKIRLVDKCAAKPHFLLHTSGKLPCGTRGKRTETCSLEEFRNPGLAFCRRKAEKPGHKINIVVNTQLEIEVFAESLGHIGDPGTSLLTMADIRDIPVKNGDLPFLHALGPGDQGHKCRFADTVRADETDHQPARDIN
ncbi:MAG: hypothetical protein BWY42_01661 [Candidatus Omnitrophica bacterium ADurb.Bin277]|nr:MAG: hypothetical protein BWY42_01661 [Candidatus Omnitrophica bacterium ADurb.Bin277]